jgi:hypothetical protein
VETQPLSEQRLNHFESAMGSDNNKGEYLTKASLPLQVMYTLQTASRSTHHPFSSCRDVSARICLSDILIYNLSSITQASSRF